MISNACATMRTAMSFLPLLRPFIIRLRRYRGMLRTIAEAPKRDNAHLSTSRSTMGICAFLNCFFA